MGRAACTQASWRSKAPNPCQHGATPCSAARRQPCLPAAVAQLWNLPWWHCSSGSCVDTSINEIEYIEKVITSVKSKFALDTNKFWVTGTSAGGMMVNYLLCTSELFQNTATAVVDMLGGVGESFLGSCSPKRQLPHLILHGMTDPIITYDRDNDVDGSKFISTRACCVVCCRWCRFSQAAGSSKGGRGRGAFRKRERDCQCAIPFVCFALT